MQMRLQFDQTDTSLPALTDEQQEVFDGVEWTYRYRPYTTIGGYAGTGKSVLLQHWHAAYPKWVVCSASWQTVNVLRMRGVPATTVYRVLYKRAHPNLSVTGRLMLDFEDREAADLRHYEGVLCDEGGIIPSRVHADLLKLNKPLIYLGDHGQLPPVNDKLALLENPLYRLETIHRNASDIIRFSMWLREGNKARDFDFSGCTSVKLVTQAEADALLTKVSQVACSWNMTRCKYNRLTRELLGRGSRLQVGDRIMTLANNHQYRVFNGMSGVVTSIDWKHGWVGMLSDHFGERYFEADFSTLEVERPRARVSNNSVAITYAYARTAYSMQGSECDSLLVIEEGSNGLWPEERANYTLATRAKKMLYWYPK